jgi:YD repeat-containing protein
VTNPLGQITRYVYDGDGKRVRMEEPAGRLISQWQKGEHFCCQLEGLGSTVAVTNETGKMRKNYDYHNYDRLTEVTVEEIKNRYTFTGQAWDPTAAFRRDVRSGKLPKGTQMIPYDPDSDTLAW